MNYTKKNVIYFINSPLSKRDFNRFGLQTWINCGWKVKVFDITKILYPKFWNYIDQSKISVNFEGLIIFQNINNLMSELNKLKNKVVFIDLLGVGNTENRIRKTAKTHGVVVKLNLGSIPYPQISSIWEKISLLKKPIIFADTLKQFLKNSFVKILAKKYYPDYLVIGGSVLMAAVNKKETSIIQAHNFDYDFFLKEKNIKQNKDSNFLVFLDEDGPYHSDYIHLGIKPYVTTKNYYPVVDLGLDVIAKSLKLNIKIAAHPRSNYENKEIKYRHPILENKTFELIRDADVVVGHSSTALQWAVMMYKPIILLTTNEIQNAFYAKPYLKLINGFASELGKKIINLDNLFKIKNINTYLGIDKEKYKKYIETYIKIKGSPEKLLWDIVIEKLEKELQLKN
jgi:hypothetical protein